jgi:type I restriction enzyme S subunit
MGSEWVTLTIGDIAEVVGGGTPSTKDPANFGGDIPWVTPKDLAEHPGRFISRGERNLSRRGLESSSACLVPAGSVILSSRAPVGYVALAQNPLATNQGCRSLIVKPGFHPEYVYYWLKAHVETLEQYASGSTFKELAGSVLKQIPIALPRSLDEQRAIARVLGALDDRLAAKPGEKGGMRRVFDHLLKKLITGAWTVEEGERWLARITPIAEPLDDKIELNRRMSETLEAMARAIFKAWFVDFEPVRAKMEGRWRKGESLPGLPAHLWDLFPDRLVQSEIGEIPEGWRVVPLTEIVAVNPPRPLRRGQIAPYLDMANMPTRGHTPDSVIPRPFGSGTRFINGDTLLARITPCLENGKTAFVDFLQDGEVGWGSTEYIVLRPKPPLPEEFAYCLARSQEFRDFAIQSMTGTSGRQRVQPDVLSRYALVSAPSPVPEWFGKFAKPLFAKAGKAMRQSRTLAAIRDALLPKLLSGEIRLGDFERALEEQQCKSET